MKTLSKSSTLSSTTSRPQSLSVDELLQAVGGGAGDGGTLEGGDYGGGGDGGFDVGSRTNKDSQQGTDDKADPDLAGGGGDGGGGFASNDGGFASNGGGEGGAG